MCLRPLLRQLTEAIARRITEIGEMKLVETRFFRSLLWHDAMDGQQQVMCSLLFFFYSRLMARIFHFFRGCHRGLAPPWIVCRSRYSHSMSQFLDDETLVLIENQRWMTKITIDQLPSRLWSCCSVVEANEAKVTGSDWFIYDLATQKDSALLGSWLDLAAIRDITSS